jgi:Dullard-like phosphatase family protein
MKRPGADEFIIEMAKHFELIIYTASLGIYADPVVDKLDLNHNIEHRLFREDCILDNEVLVKDLAMLGRELKDVIIIDNSPPCYSFQPENAIPITTWINDLQDNKLAQLVPLLKILSKVEDVRMCIKDVVVDGKIDYEEAIKTLQGNTKTSIDNKRAESISEGSKVKKGFLPLSLKHRSKSYEKSKISPEIRFGEVKNTNECDMIPEINIKEDTELTSEVKTNSSNDKLCTLFPLSNTSNKGDMLKPPVKKVPRRPSRHNKRIRKQEPFSSLITNLKNDISKETTQIKPSTTPNQKEQVKHTELHKSDNKKNNKARRCIIL